MKSFTCSISCERFIGYASVGSLCSMQSSTVQLKHLASNEIQNMTTYFHLCIGIPHKIDHLLTDPLKVVQIQKVAYVVFKNFRSSYNVTDVIYIFAMVYATIPFCILITCYALS